MNYPTADAASEAFYRAFTDGDASAMEELWLDDAESCCIHPARHPVMGHGPVMESWREILREARRFSISFHAGVQLSDGNLVVRVGTEHLTTDDGHVALLSVTNAFRRTPAGWRIMLHHAAPIQQPPERGDNPVH